MAIRSRRKMSVLRHRRLRKRVAGTAQRPRLSVFRSNRHIYAQVIDDSTGKTLAAANTLMESVKGSGAGKKPLELAGMVGKAVAEASKGAGIDRVVFDRGGFKYHGCIKSLAEGAREAGLEF
ncbi:50S ribosomal protein L18 [bacterium]|nr:50S ribosomal protein L18 [bacterium]